MFLLLQTTPSPVPDATADEVVVIAKRLERWKASINFTKAGPQCKVRQSTGDAEIDRIGCQAMQTCFPQYQSRFDATTDRGVPAGTRKVMQAALNGELTKCVTSTRTRLVADLAAQRVAAKAGA